MDRPEHSSDNRMHAVEARLAQLEKRNRRTQALLAVAAAGLLMAMAPKQEADRRADVIEAHRLQIVDADGNMVAALGSDEHGGRLDVWTHEGTNVLRMAANQDGGDMNLWNVAGQTVLAGWATETGSAFSLRDSSGAPRADLAAEPKGGKLHLGGADASLIAAAGRDRTSVELTRPDGLGAVVMDATETGGQIRLNANGNEPVALIGTQEGRFGFLELRGPSGERIVSAGADTRGGGRFALGDGRGSDIFRLSHVNGRGGKMDLFAPGGEPGIRLTNAPAGGRVDVYNLRGVPVVTGGATGEPFGGTWLVHNGRGLPVASMEVDDAENGRLVASNAEGRGALTWPPRRP